MDVQVFDAILQDVRAGTAVRRAMVAHGVNPFTFYSYIDRDDSAAERYARARASSMDAIADEAMAIADDPEVPSDQKRVMVDTRKWFLSKLAPKKYGEKLDLTHAGDPDRPLVARIEEVIIDPAD